MRNSLKEKVLEASDIVDVVGERVALRRKGREYIGLCPFHNDHNPSLYVSPQKQIFKCWSCGAGGDVIRFVQLSHRVEFPEALAILAQRAGIELRPGGVSERRSGDREQLRRVLNWARAHFQRNLRQTPAGQQAAHYAQKRGMTAATIEQFGLGYAADAWDDLLSHARRAGIALELLQQAGLVVMSEGGKVYDRFRNRLMFPICDALGRCIAFGGRTLGDDPAKYLNSPETALFSKSRVLYGLDRARSKIIASRQAIVVEGYIDAVLVSQAGFENVVATLGTALTDAHAKVLAQLSGCVLMCFDSDEAGLRAAERAAETALRHRLEVRVVIMPDGLDPADCVVERGPAAFKSLLQTAFEALEFNWRRTIEAYSGRGREGRRDAVEAFLRFVARVSLAGGIDPLEQGLLVGRLGELLSIPSGSVYELLSKAKAAVGQQSQVEAAAAADASDYELAVRGLPPGLVAAVEELFGLVLSASHCFGQVRAELGAAADVCEPWQRLYRMLESAVHERGSYVKSEVIRECDDGVLCDLIGRACARASGLSAGQEACAAAAGRIRTELGTLRLGGLRRELRQAARDDEQSGRAFRSLLDVAAQQHSVLAADQRWNPQL